MRVKVMKINKTPSKIHPGNFYYIYFQGEDGKSYKTMTSERYGNFVRWARVMSQFFDNPKKGAVLWLKNVRTKEEGIIDADSPVEVDELSFDQEVVCQKCGEPLTDLEKEVEGTYCHHCAEKMVTENMDETKHPDKRR